MAKGIHKGTEFNNVNETWNQNERNRTPGNTPDQERNTSEETTDPANLDRTIKEEAAEYDTANKEDRLLSRDRATLKDDEETP